SGYTMALINNTIFTYGGVSVDANGNRMSGAVLNSLWFLDANSFLWSSGSNGPAVTDHSTCYIPSCNCLVTFGGSQTGNPDQPSRSVYTYDLGTRSWNLQVNPGSVNGAIPGPRRLHTATCLQDRMLVYGGGTTTPSDSDVWVLDASQYPTLTWLRQSMANASQGPGARMGHTAVLDSTRRRIYIYGGWTGQGNEDQNMYILDIEKSSWSSVPSTGMSSSSSSSSNQPSSGTSSSTPVGAIAGGVVGGVVGLCAIALAAFFFIRRRKRQQQIEKEAMEKDMDDQSYEDDYRTYSLSDPAHSDANLMTPYSHKRVSKAWTSKTGTTSTRNSYARQSDNGDVPSSVMEMMSSPTDSHYDIASYLRGSRNSLAASKQLLAHDLDGPGQIPNEYVLQKPNEFSMPASQFAAHNNSNNSIPIDHYTPSTNLSTVTSDGAPLSSSMEVLRSIKTNGITNSAPSQVHTNTAVPLTHHQYPSSSVPVAQPISPQALNDTTGTENGIYDSVSPLDRLATLGQANGILHEELDDTSNSNKNTSNNVSISSIRNSQHLSISGMLPRRYKLDKSKPPVIGPTNGILFVYKTDNQDAVKSNVVVKSFGRREAWERECRTLMKLKSHHVVTLLEVLTIQDENDDYHIKYVTVMERLDETLSTAIRRARPSSTDQSKQSPVSTTNPIWSDQHTISIARDITECLIWCHEKGIAFCDLKPSNIMHNMDEPWKLIDFEASRTIGEECVGVITPRYCPPEVARATTYGLEGANGVVATASVDLWALGCVLYELETKRPLFATSIKDETILHFVSHPSSSTPILNNGLRWNDQKELEIPHLDRQVRNAHSRQLIKMLLSRDPVKRGSASQLLVSSILQHMYG
ncbi:kinase-like domain-containing protein, partial [Halteromyces radiatus]|uniref:kinase-like domain-containing protein n=1 Tax=Halteromyces radiatus TaxID=101107 RepID=UPI00221FAA92